LPDENDFFNRRKKGVARRNRGLEIFVADTGNMGKKSASVTPKSHDLWFEIQPQLTYLGRFYHFMEGPIEKLNKIDQMMDAVYCHLRDYEFREQSKKKKEAIGKNSWVQRQYYEVTQSHKRKFATATLLKKRTKNPNLP
jgi:hypothetical protein